MYEAALADDSRIAVKWYFGDSYSASLWHWQCLTNLVERGAPDARFLWPIALTSESGERPRGSTASRSATRWHCASRASTGSTT